MPVFYKQTIQFLTQQAFKECETLRRILVTFEGITFFYSEEPPKSFNERKHRNRLLFFNRYKDTHGDYYREDILGLDFGNIKFITV